MGWCAWPGAGVLWPWPCPESRWPHRSALRCAGRARGRGTERPRTALERGQEAPAPAPPCPGDGELLPAGTRLLVPFPPSFPPVLSFTMAAGAGPVPLPSPRWDCREILFHNQALSLPCCCSCCFLSLRWVGRLTYKANLENSASGLISFKLRCELLFIYVFIVFQRPEFPGVSHRNNYSFSRK